MPRTIPKILPRAGEEREALREKGQFWTPDWVADAMVAYVLADHPPGLFDPAVGAGAFFHAARRWERASGGPPLRLAGRDVDPAALAAARESGLSGEDLAGVELQDFVLDPPSALFPAMVVNPPYIRHHRLGAEAKERLQHFARRLTGRSIDGRAGLHVYFFLRCLERLQPGGRLAFIVSADICEGVFAQRLWDWVGRHYRFDAIIAFSAEATPFPGVDTNALLFLIRRLPPAAEFPWVFVQAAAPHDLRRWIEHPGQPADSLKISPRTLAEGLATGLSRPPQGAASTEFCLGDFARVMRGIVTGDNDFFFLTSRQATDLAIPKEFLVRAVGRTRDVHGERLTGADLERLDAAGRPTFLLNVNGAARGSLPETVERYLQEGESRGVPSKTLIALRRPWYKMETRETPPILFAYLGRRNARFIRNEARVVPLTCLLCIYPHDKTSAGVDLLWRLVSDPRTIANLKLVGKSYGGDAIKVEPRALERLPIPRAVIEGAGGVQRSRPAETLELAF